MSYESEKKLLAEQLLRAVTAMSTWTPLHRVQYEITLGIKDRMVDFTTDFGGAATPEPDSIAWLAAPSSASLPVIRLLYLLDKNGDDICLNAPTAQAITGRPFVHGQPVLAGLLGVLKDAQTAGFVRRTDPDPHQLTEADRDTIVGLTITDQGRRYLDDVLHTTTDASARQAAAPGI